MSATFAQAREIVARYRGQRVCIRFEASDEAWYADGQRDAHILEGRLGRGLITFQGHSVPWGFDWRRYADRYRDDPDVYAEAPRAFARPENHFLPFRLADRIEPAPHKVKPTRRQRFGSDKHDASALTAEVTAALIARAKRGAP